MHSITNVVTVTYGLNDEPEPLFQCPVVIDPTVLQVLRHSAKRIETIVSDAANAVELVSRFERATRYVDFASRLDVPAGACPVTLRVQLVQGQVSHLASIDFAAADPRH